MFVDYEKDYFSVGCVYDVVFAYPGNKTPGTWTMFDGQSTDVDIYFR